MIHIKTHSVVHRILGLLAGTVRPEVQDVLLETEIPLVQGHLAHKLVGLGGDVKG